MGDRTREARAGGNRLRPRVGPHAGMVSTAQTALAALFSLLVFSALLTVQQRNTVVGTVRRAASSLSETVASAPDNFAVASDPSITAALREMRQQEAVALSRVRASFERKRQELLASSTGPAPAAASSLSVSMASAPDSVAVATFAVARDAAIAAAQSEMTATPAAAPRPIPAVKAALHYSKPARRTCKLGRLTNWPSRYPGDPTLGGPGSEGQY